MDEFMGDNALFVHTVDLKQEEKNMACVQFLEW